MGANIKHACSLAVLLNPPTTPPPTWRFVSSLHGRAWRGCEDALHRWGLRLAQLPRYISRTCAPALYLTNRQSGSLPCQPRDVRGGQSGNLHTYRSTVDCSTHIVEAGTPTVFLTSRLQAVLDIRTVHFAPPTSTWVLYCSIQPRLRVCGTTPRSYSASGVFDASDALSADGCGRNVR